MSEQHLRRHEIVEPPGPGCATFEAGLAAYLEGETRPEVVSHVRECEYCAVILADLEVIMTESRITGISASLLPGPSPRVWANIRASLESEGYFRDQRGWWSRLFSRPLFGPSPAPVVLGIVVLTAVTFLISRPNRQPASPEQTPLMTLAAGSGNGDIVLGERELRQTVQNLEKAYEERAVGFEPVVKQGYEKGLESLDTSIRQAELSVKQQPNNDLAREYLLTAYEQKADVLASALEFNGR